MDKPDNFTIFVLSISAVVLIPLALCFEFRAKFKKKKEATLTQKLYHNMLFSTPSQRGGFESQDRT